MIRASIAVLALIALGADVPRVETRDGRKTITNAPPQPETATGTRNVLLIGNSLTYYNEMPWVLEQIAKSKSAVPPLRVEFSGGSGMSLEQHWKKGKALRRIQDGRWDFIVLQAQSTEAVREPASFEEYARRFDEAIRKRGARTVILQTWAPRDAGHSQREFNARYDIVARRLGALVAPAGVAWSALEQRGVVLFDGSGVHPNIAGSYLAASVLYALVYGRSASGAIHTFDVRFSNVEAYRHSLEHDDIDAKTAAAIHQAAWAAVTARTRD